MEKKMKYPYIGKANLDDSLVLFYSDGCGMCFRSDNWSGGLRVDYNERAFKNITNEYLQNTYGEVVSPEHAEFIIELAVNAGFEVADDDYEKGMVIEKYCKGGELVYFYTWKNSGGQAFIAFSKCKDTACNDGEKQITIPLPPKADKQESSEWPQVGDKVYWSNGKRKGELKSICDGWAWIKDDSGEFISLMAKFIQKPKTPEEELHDDLTRVMQRNLTYKQIVDDLISNFEIKKKPQ